MKIFKLCKKYLLKHKYQLIIYVSLMLLTTAVSIASPFIIGSFLDNLIEGADTAVVLRFAAVFGGLNVLRIIKGYIASIMYTKMQMQMGYNLNSDTIKYIQNLSLSYSNRQDSAYLGQRVGGDTNSLIVFCISILQNVISNTVMLAVPLIILFTINFTVAIILMAFFAVYIVLYFVFKKSLYNAGLAFMEAQNKFFSRILDQLKYIKLIKINSIQPQINQRADSSFVTYKDKAISNQKIRYLYSGLDGFVSTIAQIALFIMGGIQILAGNFTIGMFTIFTSYFNMVLNSCRYFFGLGAYYQQTLAAYDRVVDIFSQTPEANGTQAINEIAEIELKGVSFSYAEKEAGKPGKKVISDVSMKFEKGKIYCIAGANGTGKSTLISLILGLYAGEYEGRISYNGIDIREIDMISVRKDQIAFGEQEPMLVNDTIRFNIDFKALPGEGGHDEIGKYIPLLGMDEFIRARTLDYVINEKSSNTSGGEKQKISILKVLHKNPGVMIFDEPTSALDTQTAQKFIEYLCGIKQDKIIIIITHDEGIENLSDESFRL